MLYDYDFTEDPEYGKASKKAGLDTEIYLRTQRYV